uniref:Putative secreted protein n=1 Tax=Anopheles marajoara TaxID=58244 RepID=A0A2M4CB67_9DIPT
MVWRVGVVLLFVPAEGERDDFMFFNKQAHYGRLLLSVMGGSRSFQGGAGSRDLDKSLSNFSNNRDRTVQVDSSSRFSINTVA